MGKSGVGVDIPASSRVGGIGIDDDEAIRVRKIMVLSTRVIGLSSACAVMRRNEDRRRTCKPIGVVDKHANFGGIGTKVSDFCQ